MHAKRKFGDQMPNLSLENSLGPLNQELSENKSPPSSLNSLSAPAEKGETYTVVYADGVNVREAPHSQAKIVSTLNAGDLIKARDFRNDFSGNRSLSPDLESCLILHTNPDGYFTKWAGHYGIRQMEAELRHIC